METIDEHCDSGLSTPKYDSPEHMAEYIWGFGALFSLAFNMSILRFVLGIHTENFTETTSKNCECGWEKLLECSAIEEKH